MRAPSATWETTYRHDRRQHRHRCICCRRIINAGEPVLMARVGTRKTNALHIERCADMTSTGDWTWRKSLTAWGTDRLIALGYKIPAVV